MSITWIRFTKKQKPNVTKFHAFNDDEYMSACHKEVRKKNVDKVLKRKPKDNGLICAACRGIAVLLIILFLPLVANSYPTSCYPATDLQTCMECASQMYQSCANSCSSSTDWTCHRECIRELNADRNDCHGQFDPLVN